MYSFVSVDTTDVMYVTPFSTAASGVYDEITSEELKREKDKRRYFEMAARYEKILKAIECRKQKKYPTKVLSSFLQ